MSDDISNKPHRGDHIKVLRSLGYYHHGIYVSNDEVIHFTNTDDDSVLDWSKAHVMKTTLQEFLRGGEVEIVKHDAAKLYPVDDIVEYARDCLGDTSYNLFFENCEHFANECAIGEHRSKQADGFIGAVKFAGNFMGGKAMGLLSTLASGALDLLGKVFGSSSSSGRKPSKTEKVKLEEIECDRQIELAKIESDKTLKLADKEASRLKIERDTQIKILQEQTRSRMAEAEQQARFKEIENEMQLRLIDKDNERIGLMRDAQIDIIKAQTMSQLAIEKARAEGMTTFAENLAALQEKMIELSNRRLAIISECSMPIIRELEGFYGEIVGSINARREEYFHKKLPPLLDVLVQYKEGSPQYNLYYRQIVNDQDMEKEFFAMQMKATLDRQQAALESFNRSREAIDRNVNELAQIVATGYLQAGIAGVLSSGQESLQALPESEEKKLLAGQKSRMALPTREIKQLPPAK